jgi:hypothetical protein
MSAMGRKQTLGIWLEGVSRSLSGNTGKAAPQSVENANWRFYASRVRPRVRHSTTARKKLV